MSMKVGGYGVLPAAAWVLLISIVAPTPAAGSIFGGSLMAGADVVADRHITGELTVAGANVEIRGLLERQLTVFGANVILPAEVRDRLNAFGAHVVLSGRYLGHVHVRAANLVLAGTFEDGVDAYAARITLAPTAVIKGSLRYNAAVLDRAEGALILGDLIEKRESRPFRGWGERGRIIGIAAGISLWIIYTGGLLVLGMILKHVFPVRTEEVTASISALPWANVGIGLIVLLGAPLALALFLATVIGIPLAVIAGMAYIVSLYISRIYISVWIGRRVISSVKRSPPNTYLWPLATGLFLISLIGLIPFIGWLARFFFLLIGLGAFWHIMWETYRGKRTVMEHAETRSAG